MLEKGETLGQGSPRPVVQPKLVFTNVEWLAGDRLICALNCRIEGQQETLIRWKQMYRRAAMVSSASKAVGRWIASPYTRQLGFVSATSRKKSCKVQHSLFNYSHTQTQTHTHVCTTKLTLKPWALAEVTHDVLSHLEQVS